VTGEPARVSWQADPQDVRGHVMQRSPGSAGPARSSASLAWARPAR